MKNDYRLVTEAGEARVCLDLPLATAAEFRDDLAQWDDLVGDPSQRQLILTPQRRAALQRLLAVVEAVLPPAAPPPSPPAPRAA